jgi:hypothetical protein
LKNFLNNLVVGSHRVIVEYNLGSGACEQKRREETCDPESPVNENHVRIESPVESSFKVTNKILAVVVCCGSSPTDYLAQIDVKNFDILPNPFLD